MTDDKPSHEGGGSEPGGFDALDGFSARLGAFIESPGPLFLAVIALAIGAAALYLTPREEEPQIVVPVADVMVRAPGLSALQVERQIATPLENLLTQIDGVEDVYSQSRTGEAVVTVRYYVGEDREDSLVKTYNKIMSNTDAMPPSVESWVVKPVEVDDVPIVVAMLWTEDDDAGADHELRRLAEEAGLRLQATRNANRVTVSGGRPREVRVELQPEALAARQTAPLDVAFALGVSNERVAAGQVLGGDEAIRLEAGDFFQSAEELRSTVVNVVNGAPVYLGDVARIIDGPAEPADYTWIGFGPAAAEDRPRDGVHPAVSIAVAKRKGSNAVWVARDVLAEIDRMRETLFPPDVRVEVIRNYGVTADAKVNNLVSSLLVAVLTVVVFIGVVMGWRSAVVVALAIPICYGATLGFNLLTGYTINRVTLFALILALGLLVDDPITGIDNIDRTMRSGRFGRRSGTLFAMQEIRTALVMSTIAIILSFVPLFFITGMMGPYMGPMAINVPLAVTVSTFVAFLITPWMASKILRPAAVGRKGAPPLVERFYGALVRPLVERPRRGAAFLAVVAVLFVASVGMTAFRLVPLKLLPFDNKDEFQLVVDMPEGTTAERTEGVLRALAEYLRTVPEVETFSAFSGHASPVDFNGLIRQYYLREGGHLGDLRVTLAPRLRRELQSHGIVLRERQELTRIAREHGANLKIVETPPGPPVIATIVAEVYGTPTTPYHEIEEAAGLLAQRLEWEPGVVDVDTSIERARPKRRFVVDKEKAALSGIGTEDAARTVALAVGGLTATHLQVPTEVNPLPVRLVLPFERRNTVAELAALAVKGRPGFAKVREGAAVSDAPQPLVALGEIGTFEEMPEDPVIHHKNLERVVYVFADTAGRAPADAIQDIAWDRDKGASELAVQAADRGGARDLGARHYLAPGGGIPWSIPDNIRIAWGGEGEWHITWRVFRDLGLAFAAAMVGIFIVLTIQTKSVVLALIIMLAIPLSMIGIMPGFWLLNVTGSGPIGGFENPTFFTATAMIGMIALAGIVVRNSLILVEFVHDALRRGMGLDDALVQAGAIRFRPVFLTAGTTLLGNLVITLDPIFNGLAWAIIFGISASTIFTLGVIPVVYKLVYGGRHRTPIAKELEES